MKPEKRSSSRTSSRTTKKSRTDSEFLSPSRPDESQDSGFEGISQEASTSQGGNVLTQAEVGIIEKISVTNFMCHSKLDFDLGPNINFIIGRNGSGKSAVLTALVIGLGGKANVTSRGSNIRNFIKNGESFAVTEVHLRNQGPDAFKPMEYGPNIIVERKILRDGASTYKIKGKNGRIVATKKDELLAILDQFNIQVENPVSVLNQQTSRNFLSSKSPKDKYIFFLKATQLDQIKQSNADVAEKLQIAEDMLTQKMVLLPQLKREVDELENLYRTVRCLEDLKDSLQDLKKEYAWALVIEKENDSEEVHQQYCAQVDLSVEKKTQFENLKETLMGKAQVKKDLENELNEIVKEMEEIKKNKDLAKKDIVNGRNDIRIKETEKRRALTEISSVNSDIDTLQKQIEELVKTEPQDNSAEKQLRNKKILDFQERVKDLTATKTSQSTHLEMLRHSVSHYKQNNRALLDECRSIENQQKSLQQQLQNIEGSRKNQLLHFGQCIPTLVASIEQCYSQGRFRKKPIGPIGAFVSLRDPKWAIAIETCLGGLLEAFCCDNYDDAAVLKNLMNSKVTQGRKPSVIVSQFQNRVHNVNTHKVVSEVYPNILDMLVIKDVNVANTLIDQRGIESILLIENSSEARQVMTYSVPQNCHQCFTIRGDQIFPVPSFRYYTNNKSFSKYLKGNAEERISEITDHCQKLDSNLQKKRQELRESKELLEQNMKEERKMENSIAKVSLEIGKVNSQLNIVMNFVEPEPVDVSSLQDEVKLFQNKSQQLMQRVEELTEAIKTFRERDEKLKCKLSEFDEKMKVYVNDATPIKERMDSLNEELSNQSSMRKALESEIKQEQKKVEFFKKNWEAVLKEAVSMREKTENVCPRIPTNRTPANVYSEITEITKSLKREELQNRNLSEISQRFFQGKLRYKKIKDEISDCSEIIRKIKHGMELRHKSFTHLRTDLVIRIKYLFNICLNTRNYNGEIKFNHKTATLTFQVQPNASVKQLCNDMRSLSGGERSFSTVCFILALWDAMESPFRILDEYDVFMDMVNRRISMDMMMDVAKSKLNHQFIFLTPLEMSKICASRIVKICRMPDPERRMTEEIEDN